MRNPTTAASATALLAGMLLALSACADGTDEDDGTTTQTHTQTESPTETTTTPAASFAGRIADLTEVDPAPYASSLIFPQQPGYQFTGPDGTYCEIYGQPGTSAGEISALCTHSGEGDINAVTVTEGQTGNTRNVNRIFAPGETTQPLESGARLVDGAVSCGVPEGEVAVTCAIGDHGFTVSTAGVETG